ncbi:hypothetical protein Taro_032702, partial [Colocasia esculenta]|nr:hypothetical protein [Colocasia esculenta]
VGGQNATACPVAIRSHRCLCRDGLEHVAYRAIAFSGKQIATGSYEDRERSVRSAARRRRGALSRSDRDRCLCRDGPKNVAYLAVAFSGLELEELEMKLDEAFSPQILLLLGLSSRSSKP